MKPTILSCLLFAVCSWPMAALLQTGQPRFPVVILPVAGLSDPSSGATSRVFGGNVRVYADSSRLAVELTFMHGAGYAESGQPSESVFQNSLGLNLYFSRSRVKPYAAFGAGMYRGKASPDYWGNSTVTRPGVNFGFGLEFQMTARLSCTIEPIRYHWAYEDDVINLDYVNSIIGIGVRLN